MMIPNTPNTNPALDAAIALSRAPTLAEAMRSQPLPTGAKLLLRILADESGALSEARRMTGLSDKDLAAVAELYVLQVMLYRGASPRRILGVGPEAERTEIRSHMRYLMTWLHPDKAASDWHAAFAGRVIGAWRSIDRNGGPETPRVAGGASRKLLPRGVPWIALAKERAPAQPMGPFYKRVRAFFEGFAVVGVVLLLNGADGRSDPVRSAQRLFTSAEAAGKQPISSATERTVHP
jgi:hypothetical protein